MSAANNRSCSCWSVAATTACGPACSGTGAGSSPRTARVTSSPSSVRLLRKFSPDLVEHQNYGPNHAPGAEGVKAVISSLRRAFPDFHLSIEDLTVSDDTVWLRMTGSGTNQGSFMGQRPTDRTMRADVFDALRVEGDRIVEHWGCPDRLGILFQLGLAKPLAPAFAPASP